MISTIAMKGRVNWLIEKRCLENEQLTKLCLAIEKQGNSWLAVDYPYRTPFNIKDCVVAYGSLSFCKNLPTFVPGSYCTLANYEYSRYAGKLRGLLVNDDFAILPYISLLQQWDWLLERFGDKYDHLFLRPNSGYKLFDGGVYHIDYDGLEEWTLNREFAIQDDDLVVIAKPQTISDEWRAVVADGAVVDICYYRKDSRPHYERTENPDVWAIAIKAADRYQPDSAFTIDVGLTTNGKYKVVEINSFSCAGLYGVDLYKVVEAVSKVAIKDYEEF